MFLVINSGSSSIKFKLFEEKKLNIIISGLVEKIGSKDSFLKFNINGKGEIIKNSILNHKSALKSIIDVILGSKICGLNDIRAIGHRIVHGGEFFKNSVIIDDEVIENIAFCKKLAPLHDGINLECVFDCGKIIPNAKQVAVFDTVFHQSMKEENYLYAIPYEYYKKYGIRRYGFHGISHEFVYNRLLEIGNFKGKNKKNLKVISCHIGNGASITAIMNGKVIENSMGMTPLEGLIMGTRSGDIDPAIIALLMKFEKLSINQIGDILNKESGLKGLWGKSGDMRDIINAYKKGDKKASTIVNMYVNRILKYIGSYTALLGGVDAIILTAGVMEKSNLIRKLVCEKLAYFGVNLDNKKNKSDLKEGEISSKDSKVKVWVIPTNEELMIGKEMAKLG